MSPLPIYLDYAATTPVDPRVVEKMHPYLTGVFGNPSSNHAYGLAAQNAVEEARAQIAALIHAMPSEVIYTSGATESNNLALKGAASLYQHRGQHIVTLKTEHKAVLDCCQYLEKRGYSVSYLTPEPSGLLDIDQLRATLRHDTILVSVMHVNNEIGVIQNIQSIAELTAEKGIVLHVDAAQSVGKIAIDVNQIPVDLLSLCAHKLYGPKGIGALYVRRKPRVRLEPLMHGGGHEQGMRSGTLAVHQIVGMGAAFHIAQQDMQRDTEHVKRLREQFLEGIRKYTVVHVNATAPCVPHILNVRFNGLIADALLAKWPVAASTAATCQVGESYVLRALGLTANEIQSSIRFSFGRFTTQDEIDTALRQWNVLN